MLEPRDQQILAIFSDRIRARFPEAQIIAFGSRARGDHNADSDLDVCVVLDRFDEEAWMAVSHIAWEVGFERDLFIQSVVFSDTDFNDGPWSISPIVRAIKREGIAA